MRTVGLISFPKSGNTWVRHLVGEALGLGAEGIVDLHQRGIGTAPEAAGMRLYKLHAGRHPNYLPEYDFRTDHVIHVRRHPLDVFCSYLNYVSDNVRGRAPLPFASVEAIRGTDLMDVYLDAFILHGQIDDLHFARMTHGYYDHNRFWLAEAETKGRVTCLRYEDLHGDLGGALDTLAAALDLDRGALAAAAERTEALTATDGRFFWRRRAGTFRSVLTADQIDRFLTWRGAEVAALGYGEDAFAP